MTLASGRLAVSSSPLRSLFVALVCVAAHACIPAPAATTTQALTATRSLAADSALFVATFDSAWARIGRSYYDSTMRGLDWQKMRDTLRLRAAAAGTISELRGVIGRMLESLGESHFALIPADAAEVLATDIHEGADGDVGLEVRMVGNELLVSRIDSGGAGWSEGVRTGWTLLSIDGESIADLLAHLLTALGDRPGSFAALHGPRIAEARLAGRAGEQISAEFVDGGGRVVPVTMIRGVARGQVVRFGYLPGIHAVVAHQRVERGDRCVGVVRLGAWMPPVAAALDSAIVAHNRCAGIVLDLRGNPGGLAGMVMGVAGHFLPRPDSLGMLRLRETTLHLVSNPRRVDAEGRSVEPFAGRLAILVDELSASTSEIFAGAMQAIGRARVFGTCTPGYALPAQISRLPNGDLLMHAVADFALPGGARVEGRGVIPDVGISLSKAELLAGRDAALVMAVDWTGSDAP